MSGELWCVPCRLRMHHKGAGVWNHWLGTDEVWFCYACLRITGATGAPRGWGEP